MVLAVIFERELDRLRFATSMFSGAEQVATRRIAAPPAASLLPDGERVSLPISFEFEGGQADLADFLDQTDTTGLLVLADGKVVFEDAYRGNGPGTRSISWSVAKSFVSALVGIAIEDGHIESVEDPITRYVPELSGSAYEGVRIKDVLQMSSGARWNEDYSDPDSDINRFGRILAIGGSLDEHAMQLERELEPGTYNRYNSTDTHALGMLLARATGRDLSSLLEEKIWRPLGMEDDAYWLLDDEGVEFAAGGLNVSLRDYARFGLLYLQGGQWNGAQIVPAKWVAQSVTPDSPHLQPGENPASDWVVGYGYQWWIPEGDEAEFSAIGIYNQFIYVNPTRNIVIVKTSANSDYGQTDDESSYRELETIEMFRAIGRSLEQP
jgi:CubicO group peptidase (beta-lactamase class C family)